MNDRTPEQAAADTAFEDAIRDLLAAYDAEGLLTEWVLVTASHIDDGTPTTTTAVGHWVPPAQPLHRSLGALDYAVTRLRAHIAGNADTRDNQ